MYKHSSAQNVNSYIQRRWSIKIGQMHFKIPCKELCNTATVVYTISIWLSIGFFFHKLWFMQLTVVDPNRIFAQEV